MNALPPEGDYLQANYFCVRRGRTWVSGQSWIDGPDYGMIDYAPPAYLAKAGISVRHPGDP